VFRGFLPKISSFGKRPGFEKSKVKPTLHEDKKSCKLHCEKSGRRQNISKSTSMKTFEKNQFPHLVAQRGLINRDTCSA
jgi:hypothetical protein